MISTASTAIGAPITPRDAPCWCTWRRDRDCGFSSRVARRWFKCLSLSSPINPEWETTLLERNHARVVILKGRFSKEMPVREIITEKVMFVGLDDIIEERMALIAERRLRH